MYVIAVNFITKLCSLCELFVISHCEELLVALFQEAETDEFRVQTKIIGL